MRRGLAIFGRKPEDKIANSQIMLNMLRGLSDAGFSLYIYKEFSIDILPADLDFPYTEVSEFPAGQVEAVVSFGGDGTILHAARWIGHSGVPILGINTGHLGYLTGYAMTAADAESAVNLLTDRKGIVESRMVLRLEVEDMPADVWPYAVNEVAVLRNASAQMLTVRTDVDGRYLADYRGDGLIIATPTGSTAYNMSAGGPILEPDLNNIILTPIAPHSLNMRPLVIGGDSLVEAQVSCRHKSFRVSLDGRTFDLPCNDNPNVGKPLKISRADFSVNILRDPEMNFASILRTKLLWGVR